MVLNMESRLFSKEFFMLTFHIRLTATEDIAVIFAEPEYADLEMIIKKKYLIELIKDHLFKQKEVKNTLDLITNETEAEHEDEDNYSADNDENENEVDNNDNAWKIEDLAVKEETNVDSDLKTNKHIKISTKDTKRTLSLPVEKISEKEFCCLVCRKTFNCGTNARKHVKTHGIGTEPISERTCPNCKRVFKYATLCKLHVKRTCSARLNPSCDQCEMSFSSMLDLKDHIRTYHSKDKLKCNYCDFVGSSPDCRAAHEKRVHLNIRCKVCKKSFEAEADKEIHVCLEPVPFQCEECEKSYTSKGALKFHIETVHRGLRFSCGLCPDVLSNKQALERHVRNVHLVSVKNFKCNVCGNCFKDKEYLARHEKMHTNPDRSDPCSHCGKILANKRALSIHTKRVHEKNFKHTCEDCGKTFPYLNTLQIHAEMAHMKGTLHVCQICGKECIGKKRLHNHMQRKHPKGQMFGNCEHCGKEVPTTQMKSHVYETHKMHGYKFQCDYCPKRFDTKAHIRVHLRKHTKARPYLCRGCGKHFRDLMITKKHIRQCHASDYSLSFYDVSKDISNPYTN